MDIKVFTLCKQEVPESERGKKCIDDCVSSFFSEYEGIEAFSSQKRMLLAISQSLLAADIVVVAVQSNMYHATKKLLCGVLDIELEENDGLAELLLPKLGAGAIKQATYDANIQFPVESEILPTDNGLNCGFALTSGGQHLIYMPIEAPKAEEIAFGSLYDYFAGLCDGESTDSAMEQRHAAIAKRTFEKLSENSVKVVFGSKIFCNYFSSLSDEEGFSSCAVIDNDFGEKAEDISVEKYYINLSRELRDKHIAQYGIAFSEELEDDDGSYILAAIADESGTNVVRFYAEDGEDEDTLFTVAVDKLMLMLYDYNELVNADDETMISDKADKALRKAVAVAAAGIVGISAAIGLIVAWIS